MILRKNINYDFSEFLNTFTDMKQRHTAIPSDLKVLKDELNKFFKDSTCKEVLYTNNTDKMFFGMKIIAMIDADDIYDYLVEDEPVRIGKYIIEIDSHLLNPVLDLTERELLAMLLHEVGHMVGDATPIENARRELNSYLAANKDHIRIAQSIHYKEFLAYGLKDYLSKQQSMFYTSDSSEILADEFAMSYGFSNDLSHAYSKITSNNMKLYENSEISKFAVFAWTLNLYNNLKTRRVGALHTLARAKQLTGSRLEKLELDNVMRRIKRIDDDILVEASSIHSKLREKLKKHRLNNMRTIDSTMYELSMQIRNVEDEDDALYLMRQLNNNIAIIDEYKNSPDCDNQEVQKWNNLMDKFIQLRDKLSSTVVYKNKTYGIFVQYPDIVENRM
mgnify:FL=1